MTKEKRRLYHDVADAIKEVRSTGDRAVSTKQAKSTDPLSFGMTISSRTLKSTARTPVHYGHIHRALRYLKDDDE